MPREKIPTVIELIDDSAVIGKLADETRWARAADILMNPSYDPDIRQIEREGDNAPHPIRETSPPVCSLREE